MSSIDELTFINNILYNQNKKIYSFKFLIPIDDENFFTLYEIDCENWSLNDYNQNFHEKIMEFNKMNPIPLENIQYKLMYLIKDENEFIWKEFI
jgi:hypothetical protein